MRRAMMVKVAAGGGGGSFKTITIDHTKVGSSDHTDFWLTFAGTYSDLADVAHGGLLANVNNVIFAADSAGSTVYKFERVSHSLTTGAVDYRIKVPSVSHTVDTVLYFVYDASTTDRSDAANVFGSTTRMMLHMQGPLVSTNRVIDSSSSNNFAIVENNPTFVAGKVGNGMQFVRASSQRLATALSSTLQPTNVFTVSAWAKPNNFSDNAGIFDYGNNSGMAYRLGIGATSGKPWVQVKQGGTDYVRDAASGVSTGVWSQITGVYNNSTLSLYVNGASAATPLAVTGNVFTSVDNLRIGALNPGPFAFMDGLIDEACIQIGVARTADWILAQYNNQNDPSTFYALT